MKIVEITPITPWKENKGGTSGLQYHLLVERSSDVEVEVWSFNYNDLTADEIKIVEEELNVRIYVMEKPWFRTWVVERGMIFVRLLMRYPIFNYIWLSDLYLKEIEESGADGIWIYGEEMCRVSKQLSRYKRVHTFPDAQSLYYERLGGMPRLIMGRKFRRMERVMDKNVVYHLVGDEDVKWFKQIAHDVDARFIRHPHNVLMEKKIGFDDKIRLLVAGRNNLYMKGRAEEMIEVLQAIHKTDGYYITFLGKGWSEYAEGLRKIGYGVRVIEYAGGYVDEVIKHDVQITPISIGTGTKGKVLDAMANGVLVVGTEYALENVAEGGVLYRKKEELKDVLLDILADRNKYEKMALDARENIRREHGIAKVSKEFFDLWR